MKNPFILVDKKGEYSLIVVQNYNTVVRGFAKLMYNNKDYTFSILKCYEALLNHATFDFAADLGPEHMREALTFHGRKANWLGCSEKELFKTLPSPDLLLAFVFLDYKEAVEERVESKYKPSKGFRLYDTSIRYPEGSRKD